MTEQTSWTVEKVNALFAKPFLDLLYEAQSVHRQYFVDKSVQLSTLMNIKTGACPEDCAYCSQSGHHNTGLKKEKLMNKEFIIARARQAKAEGASRFCMGAAWRSPPKKDMPALMEIIAEVKALGLETCITLGMLSEEQASQLKEAGLDYYNHNLDTSPRYYKEIITTRTFQDRLDTIKHVADQGINICCGGILGMGETREDRVQLLIELSKLPQQLRSVPINRLVPIPGTPLAETQGIDNFEFIRNIAVARIMFPKARVRLSAGRESMSDEMQTLCYFAGANSIYLGGKLLTVKNNEPHEDLKLLESLGLPTSEVAC